MDSVTVITSGKGGVGKSTVTASLGAALAARGRRVLLIDCDAGLGSLDHMLGVLDHRVFDIADVVSGAVEPSKAVYPSAIDPNLFLLSAPGTEEDVVSPEVMRQLVGVLSRYYDHVLIDSPAGIGQGFLSAAAAAKRALVVATPDPVCLRAAARTRQSLEEAGVRQHRLVVNRFSGARFRAQKCYPDLDSVIDAAGVRLIAVIPEDPALAAATFQSGSAPETSPGMLAVGRLAARLEGEQVPLPAVNRF
ncbi:P-loop NTPase [Caproicibacter sp.]|uniref:nucleotide-binding protein n=1 Tax=Caproicibacter sp. TaxID=2814884 RepID=UPI003988AF4B